MDKNAMAIDEEERINDFLTQKIDEITGGEMKRVGVQKMENELTIKKLDREYLETRRNLIYSKKMLDEARKNGCTQSETKNQLLQANKAIVEKFNELKKYQNEITLVNISKGENSLQDCLDRNNELTRILHIILEKDNYFDILNKNLLDKENQLNEDIQRQIEQKKESIICSEETLLSLTKKVEALKAQVDQEKSDNRIKHAVEEKNKSIIQLQADVEVLCKQFNQEIDDLQQKKQNQVQNLDNCRSTFKTNESNISNLQSQLSDLEKTVLVHSETLEKIKIKIREISNEIQKKRDTHKMSNGYFESDLAALHAEFTQIESELQTEQTAFTEMENRMQNEMQKLFTEIEGKKKLQQTLENRQQDLSKAKQKRCQQQNMYHRNYQLEIKLSTLTEEYKKQLSIGSINTNKQIELNAKIKDLREKRDNSRKKLDNLSHIQTDTNKAMNTSSDNAIKSSVDNTKTNFSKRPYDAYRNEREDEKGVLNAQTPKKTMVNSSGNEKSPYAFNLDSSDESEEEFKIIDKTREENPSNEILSQSEKLFDELMSSQKLTETATNKKDADVFKIPSTYTPLRRRNTQIKKY